MGGDGEQQVPAVGIERTQAQAGEPVRSEPGAHCDQRVRRAGASGEPLVVVDQQQAAASAQRACAFSKQGFELGRGQMHAVDDDRIGRALRGRDALLGAGLERDVTDRARLQRSARGTGLRRPGQACRQPTSDARQLGQHGGATRAEVQQHLAAGTLEFARQHGRQVGSRRVRTRCRAARCTAQLDQRLGPGAVAQQVRIVRVEQREQAAQCRGGRTLLRGAVVDPVLVAVAFEEPGLAEQLEVPGQARLALAENLRQFGN